MEERHDSLKKFVETERERVRSQTHTIVIKKVTFLDLNFRNCIHTIVNMGTLYM